jgi:hypothetical protein
MSGADIIEKATGGCRRAGKAELDAARDRLRRGVELLNLALDLRERLYWGCFDLDDARAEVAVFKYACAAHRWWWRSQ